MKKSVSITLAALLSLQVTSAVADDMTFERQSRSRPAKWWANITAGQGVKNSIHTKRHGSSSVLSFNGAFSENVFGSLYSHHVGKYDNDDMFDRGAMVGYKYTLNKGYYALSSGLAYYQKKEPKNTYDAHKKEGVGVPVQLQAFWTPFKYVGFGVTSHAMLGKDNYASLGVGFQVYS